MLLESLNCEFYENNQERIALPQVRNALQRPNPTSALPRYHFYATSFHSFLLLRSTVPTFIATTGIPNPGAVGRCCHLDGLDDQCHCSDSIPMVQSVLWRTDFLSINFLWNIFRDSVRNWRIQSGTMIRRGQWLWDEPRHSFDCSSEAKSFKFDSEYCERWSKRTKFQNGCAQTVQWHEWI